MADLQKYYLDYNATAPLPAEVTSAIYPYIGTNFGNPSSKFNPFGRRAAEAVDSARGAIAELLGVTSAEIVFTSGGTESCYAAFLGRMLAVGKKGGRVIISAVEHPAVIEAAKLSSRLFDLEVVEIGLDRSGQLNLDELQQKITADTHLISVMAANNETGVVLPLGAVVELASAKRIPVHTDATNFVGKIPCDFKELGVSFVSMSAHKIGGLKGVGVLGIIGGADSIGWQPIFKGGGQESGRRGGTENVAGIVSLGAAALLKLNEYKQGLPEKIQTLRNKFEQLLAARLPGVVEINGGSVARLPNTSNLIFKDVIATDLIMALAKQEIYISAGSACKTGSVEISHVLRAMGVPFTAALGAVRFSFGEIFTERELEWLIESVAIEIEKNRNENLKLAGGNNR
jgi:cysteine desulfurase